MSVKQIVKTNFMKRHFLLYILLIFSVIAPITTLDIRAETDDINTPVTEEVRAEPDSDPEFPTVDTQKWRKGKFKFPWSEVVVVEDEFEGNYIAVLDRKKLNNKIIRTSRGVVSEWSNKNIKVNFYTYTQDGITNLFTGKNVNVIPAQSISLKIGEQIFELTGSNGTFPITEEIISAAKNASVGEAKLKVIPTNDGGDGLMGAAYGLKETVFEMKDETVDAWKVVYGDNQVAAE